MKTFVKTHGAVTMPKRRGIVVVVSYPKTEKFAVGWVNSLDFLIKVYSTRRSRMGRYLLPFFGMRKYGE